jgi:hypothetical protein
MIQLLDKNAGTGFKCALPGDKQQMNYDSVPTKMALDREFMDQKIDPTNYTWGSPRE